MNYMKIKRKESAKNLDATEVLSQENQLYNKKIHKNPED